MTEIRSITTTVSSPAAADVFEGQVAAGGNNSSFKITYANLVTTPVAAADAIVTAAYTAADAAEVTARNTAIAAYMTQVNVGGALYPRSAGEIAAGVTPSASLLFYPPGDIRRYGALVDGATNDQVAWQNALNSVTHATATTGGTVFCPSGTSNVATPIIWPLVSGTTLANITILGDAAGAVPGSSTSAVNYTGTTDALFELRSGTSALNAGVVGFRFIALKGLTSANTAIAINAYAISGSRFECVAIAGFNGGILVAQDAYYCVFDQVTVRNSLTYGFKFTGFLNGTKFDACRVNQIGSPSPATGVADGGIGFDLQNCGTTVKFDGCWIEKCQFGIKLTDVPMTTLDGCYFEAVMRCVQFESAAGADNQFLTVTSTSWFNSAAFAAAIFCYSNVAATPQPTVLMNSLETGHSAGGVATAVFGGNTVFPAVSIINIYFKNSVAVPGAAVPIGTCTRLVFHPNFLTTTNFQTLTANSTTPSIVNQDRFRTANTNPMGTVYTNFTSGRMGQTIVIWVDDVFTSFNFTAYGGATSLRGMAAVGVLAVNRGSSLTATYNGAEWLCLLSQA